jgi:tRNA dimethylallyltransferase
MIIGADSRQIYRGFDIGTAKPTLAERSDVEHRGIDIADPGERYSASRWAGVAGDAVEESRARDMAPLVVGGSGFYLRALFAPLFEEPPMDPVRRADLQGFLAGFTIPELRRWCSTLDPALAHLGRTQLIRAIEVGLLTGTRLSRLQAERTRPARFTARYLLVDPGATLQARIERRVRAMLDAGWEDEVRELARLVPANAPAWNASGYGVIRRLVEGDIGRDAAIQAIVIETRQYAKRQRTWFRHQLADSSVVLLDPGARDAGTVAERWWTGGDE